MNFSKKHGLNINILTLEELYNKPEDANLNCVIFTGDKENEYNSAKERITEIGGKRVRVEGKQLTQHWMAIYGNLLFDSYGYQEDYKINRDMFKFVKTHPSRLQQFDSDVCGEYVLSFIYYCNKNAMNSETINIGDDYVEFYNFSDDRDRNDKIVLEWYAEKQRQE